MKMAMLLRRSGLGTLRAFRGTYANFNFSAKTSPSPSPSPPPLAFGVSADVAADDLLLDNPPISAAKVEIEPTLLQPRVVVYDGVCHLCHKAALRVMSYLPLPYSALSSLTIVPTPLRDAVYDYVAKRRYDWFGKSPDCLVVKEKELLERFIDWEEILEKSRSES